jgi:hypothetical protein
MKTRKLGNSDLSITSVGYGAWAIGGAGWEFGWGAQNDADSVSAILKALELGVNWIDTAAVYGLGHSEEVVARALADWPGPRPYVFTKCGLRGNAQGKVRRVLTADSIRRECEESLRRLKVDALDLYQIHWPPENDGAELEEGWAAMAALQREGKARWIGVSNFNVAQLERARAIAPVTSLQPPYSLIRRDIEFEVPPLPAIGDRRDRVRADGFDHRRMTRERAPFRQTIGEAAAPSSTSPTSPGTSPWSSGSGRWATTRPLSRRSCHRLDAQTPRSDRRHRRRAECGPGGRCDASRQIHPERGGYRRDRGRA